ncbi:MAG: hypothetical protein ACI9KE_001527 [Polyangiales bacterium]|jgi:hypothetical protein
MPWALAMLGPSGIRGKYGGFREARVPADTNLGVSALPGCFIKGNE